MDERWFFIIGLAIGTGAIGGMIGSGLWLLWERMRK
jgi:hypothetical protein